MGRRGEGPTVLQGEVVMAVWKADDTAIDGWLIEIPIRSPTLPQFVGPLVWHLRGLVRLSAVFYR